MEMWDKFNGSYVLAIASYNAGPGRMRQWTDRFGAPVRDVQVYRYLLAGHKPSTVMISEDLTR